MRAWTLVMMMVCLSDESVRECSVGKILRVSKLSKAIISCPAVMANTSELKYLLLFNGSCIGQIHLNKQSDSAESVFSGQFEVKAHSNGEYICALHVIYPPPFKKDCHKTEVILAEKHHLTTKNDTVQVDNQCCQGRSPFIPDVVMWAGCGILLVYSLSITCCTIVIWRKQKRDEEDTNIYINTRPMEFGKPGKV